MGEVKSSVIKEALGGDYEIYNTLRMIRRTSGIQARMPYDFEVL